MTTIEIMHTQIARSKTQIGQTASKIYIPSKIPSLDVYNTFPKYPSLHLTLNKTYKYVVMIHDPDYFLINGNPGTTPRILQVIDGSSSQHFYIKTIHNTFINREGQPCESSESYSFTACMKSSVSRLVGCRMEWDRWSPADIPVCDTVEQILRFEDEYSAIELWDKRNISNYTGCLIPCRYAEYRLAEEPLKLEEEKLILYFILAEHEVTERTEVIFYPVESFVSELGGALGLFIGFSFKLVRDSFEYLMKYYLNLK